MLGAGETSELTARALAAQGVATLFVANRRIARARSLAEQFGGRALSFDRLPDELVHADMVVASTASPHPIVGAEELEQVVAHRAGRPLLLLDLAVPRDIDPACGLLPGVTLYDVDALHAQLHAVRSGRKAEAVLADAIVEEEITVFAGWLGSLEVLPTIVALREHGNDIVESVLAENEGRWEALSDADRERLELVARTVMNRLLHEPTATIKGAGADRRHARMQLVRELFGLEEPASAGRAGRAARRRARAGAAPPPPARDRRVTPLRLGTRGSALALAQARSVAEALGGEVELVTIVTAGDRARDVGDKSRWTGALERALLDGEIDLAVHSAKDVPGDLAPGCALAGAPPRADPHDALVGADSLAALPPGARIGTSALRRAALIRAERDDLSVVELRGNVDTRLAKLQRGDVDAIVLAAAGLERLGHELVSQLRNAKQGSDPRFAFVSQLTNFVPAPGQGILALEVRADDDAARAAAERITDADAWRCLAAERAVVRALGAYVPHAGRRACGAGRRRIGAAGVRRAAGRVGVDPRRVAR